MVTNFVRHYVGFGYVTTLSIEFYFNIFEKRFIEVDGAIKRAVVWPTFRIRATTSRVGDASKEYQFWGNVDPILRGELCLPVGVGRAKDG